jgi:hypothetical protein
MARAHDEVNKLSVRSRRRRRQLRDPIERAGDESNDEGWRARWRAGRAGGLGQDWQTRGQERTVSGRARDSFRVVDDGCCCCCCYNNESGRRLDEVAGLWRRQWFTQSIN